MGKLGNIALGTGVAAASYVALDQAGKAGIESAERTSNVILSVAGKAIEVIQNMHIQVGDMAPLSDFGIQQIIQTLAQEIQSPNILGLGIITGVSVLGGAIGGWGSNKIGNILKAPSKSDNSIAKISLGLSTLGAILKIPEGINIALAGGTYIVSRKLGERVLGEKYSKLAGFASTLAGYSYMTDSSLGLSAAAVAGAGSLVWKLKDNVKGASK